jgi:hypothetical protein
MRIAYNFRHHKFAQLINLIKQQWNKQKFQSKLPVLCMSEVVLLKNLL